MAPLHRDAPAVARRRTYWAVPVVALVLVVVAAVWQLQPYTGRAPADVVFRLTDGRGLVLDELRGRPVLVSFWATTCVVCLREIPHLKRLYRQAAPRGLVMVAVAMPYDRPDEVLELAAARELPWAVALDPTGEVLRAFGKVPGTPTHFLIDAEGRVVLHRVGALDIHRVLELLPPGPSG